MLKKTPLRRAVEYLKESGKIERDLDIAIQLGYSKGQISTYLKGTATPSKPFLNKFEEFYNLSLSDFEQEHATVVAMEPKADYRSKYIDRLEQLLDSNLKSVEEKLNQIDKSQATLYSFLEVVLEEVIASRATTEKQAQEISLSAHKRFAEKLTKIH